MKINFILDDDINAKIDGHVDKVYNKRIWMTAAINMFLRQTDAVRRAECAQVKVSELAKAIDDINIEDIVNSKR